MQHTIKVVAAAKRMRGKGWHMPSVDMFEESDDQLACLLGADAMAQLLAEDGPGDQPSDDDGRWECFCFRRLWPLARQK
jgi:hypothetical protein